MPSKKTSPKVSPAPTPLHVVKGSAIHHRGIFALRDIPKGTRILEYFGERITKKESLRRSQERIDRSKKTGEAAVYIFELNSRYDLDGSSVENNDAMFINHSCKPNCEAFQDGMRIFIEALNDIKEGDELLYNYGFDLDHWEDHECRCGSENCVGFIVDEKYWPKLLKILQKRADTVRASKQNGTSPSSNGKPATKKRSVSKKKTASRKKAK
jgi:uncharacterized protein